MKTCQVSPRAESDLDEIFQFIANDNPDAAFKLSLKFHEKFRQLAEYPGLGRSYAHFRPGMRGIAVGRYIIFYRQIEGIDAIEVIRVIHGARNYPKLFRDDADA